MMQLKTCLGAAAVLGAALSAEACTSWAIHRSLTQSGRMIIQKCRDSYRGRLDADIRSCRTYRRCPPPARPDNYLGRTL